MPSMATTNIPSTDVNLDYSEDKIFKKFINRKTIEDSIFEEPREGYLAKKKSGAAKTIINRKTVMNTNPRKISLAASFASPRKTETNPVLKSPFSNHRPLTMRKESNPLSLYLNDAEVPVKKKAKVLQPLSQFVRSNDPE